MMTDQFTLGEYIRRLRRQANRSLHSLSEETGISYSHLSRIENDSTLPNAGTVARIATALDGDLKLMLEMADCLPRTILDRIMAREEAAGSSSFRRASGQQADRPRQRSGLGASVPDLALAAGVEESEVSAMVEAIDQLVQLGPRRRAAVIALIRSLYEEDDAEPG